MLLFCECVFWKRLLSVLGYESTPFPFLHRLRGTGMRKGLLVTFFQCEIVMDGTCYTTTINHDVTRWVAAVYMQY